MSGEEIQGKLKVIKSPSGKVTYRVIPTNSDEKKNGLAVSGQAKCFLDKDATPDCDVTIVLGKNGQPEKVTISGRNEVSGLATERTGPGTRGGRMPNGNPAPANRARAAVDATAPYNFISAEKVIGFPAEREGTLFSGTIRCTLKALTPLLVAGATNKAEVDAAKKEHRPVEKKFFRVNDIPTIPAASLKGMIRAAVEILSAASMAGQVSDRAIGFRDVASGDGAPYGNRMRGGDDEVLTAGFLEVVGSVRSLTPCEFIRFETRDPKISAAEKTEQYLEGPLEKIAFVLSGRFDTGGIPIGKIVRDEMGGSKEWRCVFTGPMPGRNGPKSLDYIFYNKEQSKIDVKAEVWDAFQDQLTIAQENLLSVYRKKGLPQPLFFLRKKVGNTDAVTAIGLARFFRLTSRHRTAELVKKLSATDELGLPERIFGRIGTRSQSGRVMISCGAPSKGDTLNTERFPENGGLVAGNPAASAVAMYLEQNPTTVTLRGNEPAREVNIGLVNFDEQTAPTLRGRKLYWHRTIPKAPLPPNDNSNVQAIYFPLQTGSMFNFTVSVDRVDEIELGALISSIALPESSAHKLGLGKAFGCGSVRIEIDLEHSTIGPTATRYSSIRNRKNLNNNAPKIAMDAVAKFQEFVALKCDVKRFEEAPHVLDFRRMTEFKNPPSPDKIRFMPLSPPKDGGVSYKRKAILGKPNTLMPVRQNLNQ